MRHPETPPPNTQEELRTAISDALDEITAQRGPRSPLALVLAGALLRGDRKSLRVAWLLYNRLPATDVA